MSDVAIVLILFLVFIIVLGVAIDHLIGAVCERIADKIKDKMNE